MPSEPGLRTTGLHEFDRQSQPSRRGCHGRELQDQPFTFCRRFGTANVFSTVFSMHSIAFLLRETEPERTLVLKIPRFCSMSLYKPKAVYASIHFSRWRRSSTQGWYLLVMESGAPGDWYTVGKANVVLRELYCSVLTKRELSNTAKLSVFKSIFVPILSYGHESWVMTERILTRVQAPKLGFLRRVHGVTNRRTG